MKRRTLDEFREIIISNAEAIFVKTKIFNQEVDLPISHIRDEKERKDHIERLAKQQLKVQEKKLATLDIDQA